MKYLKFFNESRTDELKQFCNDNLAFFIDDGFSVKCKDYYGDGDITISIKKDKLKDINFNWFDVRDDIIPFMIMLYDRYNDKYTIDITFITSEFNKKDVSYSNSHIDIKIGDIIGDKLKDIEYLQTLNINIIEG